jgi:hypothetical protein
MKTTLVSAAMNFRNYFSATQVNSMFEVMPGDIIFSPKPKTKPKTKTDYSVLDV